MSLSLLAQDFDLVPQGTGKPIPTTKALLVPKWLDRKWPAPPWDEKLMTTSAGVENIGWSLFRYYILSQGYGDFAHYLTTWKLGKKKAMWKTDAIELLGHCENRLLTLQKAYFEGLYTGIRSSKRTALKPKRFYPLIEQSEKTGLSYALGCAYSAAMTRFAVVERKMAKIDRFFHRRLIDSALALAPTTLLPKTATPDWIAVAYAPGGVEYHVVEGKGSGDGGFPYKDLAEGIAQVSAIGTINGLAPRTRSVCVACHWSDASKRFVLCNRVQLPAQHGDAAPLHTQQSAEAAALLQGLLGASLGLIMAAAKERQAIARAGDFDLLRLSGLELAVHTRASATLSEAAIMSCLASQGAVDAIRKLGREVTQLDAIEDQFPSQGSARDELEERTGVQAADAPSVAGTTPENSWVRAEASWLYVRASPDGIGPSLTDMQSAPRG